MTAGLYIPGLDWPDDTLEVECVGFSEGILYNLIVAIDHDRVEVVSNSENGWSREWTFDYLGFRYRLEAEIKEDASGILHIAPYRMTKIAKMGVDDDGEPVVVESYPLTKAIMKHKYEGTWGSF